MRHALLAIGLLLGLALLAAAAEPPPAEPLATSPGDEPAVERTLISGTLAALDTETRTVFLELDNGETMSFVAGPEVQNFAQLEVGDRVDIEHVRALALELRKGSAEEPWRIDDDRTIRAVPGEKPAGATGTVIRALVEVTALHPERGTITVRGPRNIVELKIANPDRLAEIAVGDRIEATYVEAGAIAVRTPAPN